LQRLPLKLFFKIVGVHGENGLAAKEHKEGMGDRQGNVWQRNKIHSPVPIPLPNIPLPIVPLRLWLQPVFAFSAFCRGDVHFSSS
jgi:hypothetical protein